MDKVDAKKTLDAAVAAFIGKGGEIQVSSSTIKNRAKKKKLDTSKSNSFVTYHNADRNRAFGGM